MFDNDNALERLLGKLFMDEIDSGAEEIAIFKGKRIPKTSSCCCTYNYTAFGG